MLRPKEHAFRKHQERFWEWLLVFFTFNIVWLAVLWVLLIGKLARDGLHDFFIHLTNWGWTLQAVFFLLETLSKFWPHTYLLHDDNNNNNNNNKRESWYVGWGRNELALTVIGFLFWTTFGTALLIMALSRFMLADNPRVLTDLQRWYDIGFLLDLEWLFHSVPFVMILLYLFAQEELIGWTLAVLTYRGSFDWFPSASWLYLIVVVLASPYILLGLYVATFNPKVVYGIQVPDVVLALVSAALLAFIVSLVFVVVRRRHVH